MSRILLLVCLAFCCAVYADTRIRLINAQYDNNFSFGLTTDPSDRGNSSLAAGITGGYGPMFDQKIPATDYVELPNYSFTIGEELSFYAFNANNLGWELIGGPVNATLMENQSYSVVYVAQSDTAIPQNITDNTPTTTFPTPVLLFVEERPNPSPFGKAVVKIVNVAGKFIL